MSEQTSKLCVESDGDDLMLVFPDPLLNKLGWKEGDDLQFIPQDDGGFIIKKIKQETVSIDLPDKVLFDLMTLAHEKNITLNELINDVIRNKIQEHDQHLGDTTSDN